MVPRKTEAPIEIDGAVVPAGFNCLINIVGLQRTESVFPEADTWNPDRSRRAAAGPSAADS